MKSDLARAVCDVYANPEDFEDARDYLDALSCVLNDLCDQYEITPPRLDQDPWLDRARRVPRFSAKPVQDFVHRLRCRLHETNNEVAERFGVTRRQLTRLLEISTLSLAMAECWADRFGKHPSEFWSDYDSKVGAYYSEVA